TPDPLNRGNESLTRLCNSPGVIAKEWGEELGDSFPDDIASSLLNISTRNEEANYVILSGEYPNGHDFDHLPNNSHLKPEDILGELYTRDWDDDGKAASKVTDWLAEHTIPSSDELRENPPILPRDELKDKGLDALLALFDNEDFRETMSNTGHSVVDEGGGEDGKDETWYDVSAGHLNPELANGFGDVFLANMEVFGDTNGVGDAAAEQDTRFSAESRIAFMQVPMADSDTATSIYQDVLTNSAEKMEEFLQGGDFPNTEAGRAGAIQGLVEQALLNESQTRGDNHNEQIEHYNKVTSSAVDVLGSVDLGLSGPVVEVAKIFANEILEKDTKDEVEINARSGTIEKEYESEEKLNAMAVSLILGEGGDGSILKDNKYEEMVDFIEKMEEKYAPYNKEKGEILVDGPNGTYVPPNHMDWDLESTSGALKDIFSEFSSEDFRDTVGGTEKNLGDATEDFLGSFNRARTTWEEHAV
ncbi:hypothetical protein, partial [Nocardiopsis metallicus]|uniref:TPR repeat region-containing protein n=1 Tax=Nocardiopsis metallicus TaxID=179819 RepID=UPI0031D8B9D3